MKPVIIGTAGHIDHGKTALVRALTGTNTDRLTEEQKRGITIELGYAFLSDNIAIIDVPGHERFIKNMVAGVATIDFVVLIIAADDGIMPQTKEHFEILRLMGVDDGIIVVTKCALAEPDWVDLVVDDIEEMVKGTFLEGKPILRADSLDNTGIPEVKEALFELATHKKDKPPGPVFRLPIDRVFSIKGFGTVVTGSALSGTLNVDDKLELLPKGEILRIRGIESQGQSEKTATEGMRLALNVSGASVEDIDRGDVLATPGKLSPTFMLDVDCRILKSSPIALEQRQRVRVHLGTKEVMARVVILNKDTLEPGEEGLVQLRLEERTSAQRLDRYVIRRYSPQVTIGGGRILDANPQKHRKRHTEDVVENLKALSDAKEEKLVLRIVDKATAVTFDELVTRTNMPEDKIEDLLGILGIDGDIIELTAKGKRYLCSKQSYDEFITELTTTLSKYHQNNPLRGGAKKGEILSRWNKKLPGFVSKHYLELALASRIAKTLGGDILAAFDFDVQLTKKQRAALEKMKSQIIAGGFTPPDITTLAEDNMMSEKQAKQLIQVQVDQGELLNLEGKIYFHKSIFEKAVAILQQGFKKETEMTMSQIRILLDTTRKYALPLMSFFDSNGLTTRTGDVRVAGPKLYGNEQTKKEEQSTN